MKQDEIIEMAVLAGFESDDAYVSRQELKAFAKLVAAKEREACAKVCDNKQYVHPYHDLGTLIRARGEANG
jgi:hypothetical protein